VEEAVDRQRRSSSFGDEMKEVIEQVGERHWSVRGWRGGLLVSQQICGCGGRTVDGGKLHSLGSDSLKAISNHKSRANADTSFL
jgi:hypothetical protein